MDFWSNNKRYRFGGTPKAPSPPPLPAPVATPTEIAPQAGEAERRRIRGRRGRPSTIIAGKGALHPAATAQAGLKTSLG